MQTHKNFKDAKVLILEGPESSGKHLGILLLKHVSQVENVSDLKQAHEWLSHNTIDLVVSDFQLKEGDLFHTLSSLRQYLSASPLVAIGGPEDMEMMRRAMNEGASDYISHSTMSDTHFMKVAQLAFERSLGTRSLYPTTDETKNIKLSALQKLAEDVLNDIQPIVNGLTSKEATSASNEDWIKKLKNVTVDLKELSDELSAQLIKTNSSNSKVRILVVEDEPEVSEIIVSRLERLGFSNVDTAENGQVAYNKCVASIRESHPYDAIISDWKMPKMNGMELLRSVRNNDFLKRVPFMIISAVDDRSEIQELPKFKVSQYLLKPFTKEDFDKRLKRLLYQRNR